MVSERKFIKENVRRVLLKEFLRAQTQRAGFGGIDIQRTPLGTHITLIAERPGLVIGRRGSTINELTRAVEQDYLFEHPQIEVSEVANPALNPHIMAQKLALALERGWHFRRAGHSTVLRIMEAGAKGCQITIAGKLTGERHRTVRFRQGHIKYCGEPRHEFMWEAYAVAMKKAGMMGIKVQIMDPNARLPDEIDVVEPADAIARGLVAPKVEEVEVIGGRDVKVAPGEDVSKEELEAVLEATPKEGAKPKRPRAKKAAPAEGEAKPKRPRAKKAAPAQAPAPEPAQAAAAPKEDKPEA
jgi:small subunit ribosomal protein S3